MLEQTYNAFLNNNDYPYISVYEIYNYNTLNMTEPTRNQTSLSRGREVFNRNVDERPVKGFPLGRAYKYNFLFCSKCLISKNV